MQIQNIFPTGEYGDGGRVFMVKDGAAPWVTVATLSGTTWTLTAAGDTLRDSIVTADITDRSITTADLADAAVTRAQVKTRSAVALADAAAILTAAQMVDSGIFTITPTVARILTTDTAAAIVAALPRYQVGTWFEFTVVNLAAFVVTLAGGTGVTLSGVATTNAVSGTWLARIDSATAITIYRE